MKQARVQLYGITGKYVVVNLDATEGATVGKDLRWPDGSIIKESDLRQPASNGDSGLDTTDDLDEGRYNYYFTAKRAQDAVGGILQDTDTIDFTYDGNSHTIKADLKDLPDSGTGSIIGITRDGKGRVSGTKAVTSDDLTEGSVHKFLTVAALYAMLGAGDGISITQDGTKVTITFVGLPIYLVDEFGNQLTDEFGNPLVDSATTGLPIPFSMVTDTPTTRDGYGITDVPLKTDPAYFPPYTMAGAPAATTSQYKAVTITDLAEGPRPCWSDGANWRRFSDNSIAV